MASGGSGSIRKATLPSSQLLRDSNPHERQGRSTTTSEIVVAVKSLQVHGDIDSERFEKVWGFHARVRG